MSDVWTNVLDEHSIWHDGTNGRPTQTYGVVDVSSGHERSNGHNSSSYIDEDEQSDTMQINATEDDVITISSSSPTRSNISQEVDLTPSASWENAAKDLER